jgi:hypothetical protein
MKLALSLFCTSALATTAAVAQQLSGPELSWEAPAGCPQAGEVRARIDTIAGSAVKRETRLQAHARITRADGRFHLRLVLRDGELMGERNISADSCEDLAGATAVALGLMLRSEAPLTENALRGAADSSGTASNDEPVAPLPAPTATSPDTPTSEAASEAASEGTSSTRRWRALVRVPAIVAELGPLPEPSLGFALSVGGAYDEWRFLVSGQLWLSQTVRGTDLPSYGARLGRQAAAFTVGRGFRFGNGELAPCFTLALERITARGTGAGVEPSDAQAVWLGVGAGVQGSLELWPALALFADLGGRIETSRPLIAIDGLGNVRQLGPVALDTAVGLEWRF